MKKYEEPFKLSLPMRMPLVIRVDGKGFSTYTKSLKKAGEPFNEKLENVMNLTAIKLCEEIQGAQIAYVQSDEISILLHNYKKLTSQGWFNNELQKMVSVSASIAGTTFTAESWKIWGFGWSKQDGRVVPTIKPAYFDSRVFILPEAEVCNYFIWRQQDATRNSVQMLARSLFSHKKCNNKNNSELQEMCFQAGRNWNDEPTSFRRGRCVLRRTYEYTNVLDGDNPVVRHRWEVDSEIPVFSGDREYIEKHLLIEDE
jgi:tRNA(His) 5'-end guanylyltransferase